MNDFGLKCCGVEQKCKNNITGETVEKGHFESGLLLRERDVYGADLWRVPDHSAIAAFVSSMRDGILPMFRDVLLVWGRGSSGRDVFCVGWLQASIVGTIAEKDFILTSIDERRVIEIRDKVSDELCFAWVRQSGGFRSLTMGKKGLRFY